MVNFKPSLTFLQGWLNLIKGNAPDTLFFWPLFWISSLVKTHISKLIFKRSTYMKIITAAVSLIVLSYAMMSSAATSASSIEFMCKAKAKEIAAETYKGCVTENKQAQLDQIRKEYQAKLSELKNTYNSRLKQLSTKGASTKPVETNTEMTTTLSDMPAKKMKSTKVKSEKIDFSSASKSDSNSTEVSVGSLNESTDDAPVPAPEIVEIPTQQE